MTPAHIIVATSVALSAFIIGTVLYHATTGFFRRLSARRRIARRLRGF